MSWLEWWFAVGILNVLEYTRQGLMQLWDGVTS